MSLTEKEGHRLFSERGWGREDIFASSLRQRGFSFTLFLSLLSLLQYITVKTVVGAGCFVFVCMRVSEKVLPLALTCRGSGEH